MKICPVCAKEYADEVKFCSKDGQALKPKSATGDDLVGHVIAERFDIQRKLGEGGMGQVYFAEHVKMGRPCAIKVLMPNMVEDADAISRFNREASNASRINHPNVCQVYDFGETDEGLIYLAMEFIEGEPLGDLIDREGAMSPERAAFITRQVADALQAAHDLGIVHRDLKPDNIMITKSRDGRDVVKVVDFGIAKAFGPEDEGQQVTKTGFVIGTPEYMSPEQLSGEKVDGRSDTYSLGLVAYRLLTGELPFKATTAQEVMIARLTDKPMPLTERRPDLQFPEGLDRVFDRALARRAVDRYQTAAEFGADIMRAASDSTVQVPIATVDTGAATQLVDSGTVVAQPEAATDPPATRAEPAPTALIPETQVSPAPATVGKKKAPMIGIAAAVLVIVGAGVGAAVIMGGSGQDDPTGQPAGLDTSTPIAGGTQIVDTGGQTDRPNGNGGQPAGGDPDPGRSGDETGQPPQTVPESPDSGPTPLSLGTDVDPLEDPEAGTAAELNTRITEALDSLFATVADEDFGAVERRRTFLRLRDTFFRNPDVTTINQARIAQLIASGWVYQGDLESARVWFERGAALDPTNQGIQSALRALNRRP